MTRAAIVLLLLALACGKYGPPVRAGQAGAAKPPPRIEVPLPAASPEAAPSGTPASAPEPEVEQEPPPEGTP
jgi:hypothetical protein